MEKHILTTNFVLLSNTEFNLKELVKGIERQWSPFLEIKDVVDWDDSTICFSANDTLVFIGFKAGQIPNGGALNTVRTSHLWENAETAAKEYVAYLFIIAAEGKSYKDDSIVRVALATTALGLPNSIALCSMGKIMQSSTYIEWALRDIKNGVFPTTNVVHYNVYRDNDEDAFSGYTYGLFAFKYKEIELLHTHSSANDVIVMLADISRYILENDIVLRHGEPLSFLGSGGELQFKIVEHESEKLYGTTLSLIPC